MTGQVARDMWLYRKKYAFMTNYLFTVFLRQDLANGRVKLFYSSAIPNDGELDTPSKEVSVRACMLHLAKRASEDPTFDSQRHIALENWAGENNSIRNQKKTVADTAKEAKARERGIHTDKGTGSSSNTSQPRQVTQAATSSEANTDNARKTRSQSKAKDSDRETESIKGKQPIRPKPRGA